MKSIHFTDEHVAFRAAVRRFAETELAPQADAWEKTNHLPREIFRRLGELGYLAILAPPEYGGVGGDLFMGLTFLEEMPRSRSGGLTVSVAVQQFMAPAHILKWGSEKLKQKYVRESAAGKIVGAIGVTEPDSGSDVASIRTRAEKKADHWLVNGSKTFITNGADGDFVTLAVKTDPTAGARGVSLLVVDQKTPGFTVARRLEKLGWHSSDTAELAFEDVKVPLDHLVGEENRGFGYLMEGFQLERLCSAAMSVGSAQVCLDAAVAYMNERATFGKKLIEHQALAHRLADAATRLAAARALTYHAAWLRQSGNKAVAECSMAKLFATETAKVVADECLQFLGGYGLMEEYPLSRLFRDIRGQTIVAGTSEIMREIVSRGYIDASAASKAQSASK